ncbi:hypothetical protein PENTCL1PPCAC_13928, partial [Pristionchus entomophagus]
GTGFNGIRNSASNVGLLILEAIVGLIVALSNVLIGLVLCMGLRRFMKNHFYIVLANLIVCTSLKAFVELAFVLPYYIIQSDGTPYYTSVAWKIFSREYERIIFNVSVFADYGRARMVLQIRNGCFAGVLFFSMLIAINRYRAVLKSAETTRIRERILRTALSCLLVWCTTAVIPFLFYLLQCQYTYESQAKLYRNTCVNTMDQIWTILLNCLIYLSYACAVAVFAIYLLVYRSLRRKRRAIDMVQKHSNVSITQMRLLKQSVVVFALYAASIASVLVLSLIPNIQQSMFELAYIENLLNLSIAAAYPICFLSMSGEMK